MIKNLTERYESITFISEEENKKTQKDEKTNFSQVEEEVDGQRTQTILSASDENSKELLNLEGSS